MIRNWWWFPFSVVLLVLIVISWSSNHTDYSENKLYDSLTCPERLPFFLPDELQETSGLVWFDSLLWTINYSGNEPLVFGFNPGDGHILRTARLMNATNEDWEELTIDDKYLFVGDIGNNDGSRHNLCIYRVPLQNLHRDGSFGVQSEKIEFSYASQENFTYTPFKTPWDAESFLVYNDTVFVFTKDWVEEGSNVFVFPSLPGLHLALQSNTLKIEGLLTGASSDSKTGSVIFCGYHEYQPFISITNWNEIRSETNPGLEKIICDSLYGIQTEGIAIAPDDILYLSSENSVIPQSLFRYRFSNLK
ncbi:MAG: hypothetical protein U0T82_03880 [Bacteroidales bacterium]